MTNDVNYNQLGQRIKHYRQKAHKTQEQLAAQIDVATSTVAHAENGTSKPSLPLLIKIANALSVTLDQLVCDSLSREFLIHSQIKENHSSFFFQILLG